MYNFEKLKAWQESIVLAEEIYQLTKKFPKEERFALVDQLKRAVTSISLNISEGSGSKSRKVFCGIFGERNKIFIRNSDCLKVS